MCGLGGHVGIPKLARMQVSVMLGYGNDARGGHASGCAVRREDGGIHLGKRLGKWKDASTGFLVAAGSGVMSMVHARYATCGKKTADEAHPFAVKRDGATRLWGMHNGVIDSARDSAKKHEREFSVDSFELLQLLADEDYAGIQEQEGYGTLVWTRRDDMGAVRVVKMTDNADLFIVKLKEGGFVYGSTWEIVRKALEGAKLESDCSYTLTTGEVLRITPDEIKATGEVVKLKERKRYYATQYDYYSGHGPFVYDEWVKKNQKERDDREKRIREADESWKRKFQAQRDGTTHAAERDPVGTIPDWRDSAKKIDALVDARSITRIVEAFSVADLTIEDFEKYDDDDLAALYDLKPSDVRFARLKMVVVHEPQKKTCRICSLVTCTSPDDDAWHCEHCTLHLSWCGAQGCGRNAGIRLLGGM